MSANVGMFSNPDEKCPQSGIYKVIMIQLTRKNMKSRRVNGKKFPPCRDCEHRSLPLRAQLITSKHTNFLNTTISSWFRAVQISGELVRAAVRAPKRGHVNRAPDGALI